MELMFEVISRQKFTLHANAGHVFSTAGGYIGRGEECEWVLPDKARQISRKHLLISSDQKNFYLEDLSTNGVFLVLGRERIPKGSRYKIEHGVSFYIGEYTIQARLLLKPNASYLSGSISTEDTDLIPDDTFLDLDPLRAMEQQDEFQAKRRLGLYDDLLGTTPAKSTFQADHSEPPTDTLLSINAIPESRDESSEFGKIVPEPPAPLPPEPVRQVETVPETEAFFRTLGFSSMPETPEERERILALAAELLLASVDGMLQSLRNRADSKNDLRLTVTTMTLASNNPLKFSPTAKAALEYLLTPGQEGLLSAPQAMLAGFNDLHSHHMGLLAGARAAVGAVLDRISPEKVEAQLDAAGHTRFNRTARLWNTYTNLHRHLKDDPEFFAASFLGAFARAYEAQGRTLQPTTHHSRRE